MKSYNLKVLKGNIMDTLPCTILQADGEYRYTAVIKLPNEEELQIIVSPDYLDVPMVTVSISNKEDTIYDLRQRIEDLESIIREDEDGPDESDWPENW